MSILSGKLFQFRKIKWWHWLLVSLLAMSGFLYWAHSNPLYSDEEMIAKFHAHRAEIESLVQSYRFSEFTPTPEVRHWGALPEVKALMRKAGVERVHGTGPIWFPNPYSMEAAKEFDLLLKSDAGKSGAWFFLPYQTVEIQLINENRPPGYRLAFVLHSSGPNLISKELVYMPEIPRIENGLLLHPVIYNPVRWFPAPTDRVFPSLNSYPPNWNIKGECVYRQFEPHWFIRMCTAAV